MKRRPLSRRTFLRGSAAGAAVALALPPLEAMLNSRGAYADAGDEGPFFGIFYWANGLPWHAAHGAEQGAAGHQDLWTPRTTGAGFAATELLQPIMRHQPSVITGLEPKTTIPSAPAGQGDGHMRGFMVAMTGDRPRSSGFDHGSHTLTALRPSLDQYVARHGSFYGTAPHFRSVEVGVSTARFHEYGHWNHISYNGPDSTNAPIMRATQLFDMLFSMPVDEGEEDRRGLALDAVLEDARDLRGRLGVRDQARLDAHLENIHEIKRRLESDTVATCEMPERPRESGDLRTATSTMAELLAVAVSCGLTRSFSFMLTSPASTHRFRNLGVSDGMHKACHDGDWEDVRKITRYQMECFGLFLDAFAERTHPAGGTLLDAGLVYGTSEYGEGWKHGVRELPVVMAGQACGALRSGVHVRRARGNLADAQLTALRALGLPERQWGWNGGETTSAVSELLT